MDEETAAAANVDPDATMTGEAIDKGLDVSGIEAAQREASAQDEAAGASEGGLENR